MTSGRFDGRAGIVTGASSGIGAAIARRLAAEGAALCLVAAPAHEADLDRMVDEVRSLGGEAFGLALDVGHQETARRVVAATSERLGRLDFLANNAGIAYVAPIFETPIEHLDEILHVNVRGTFLLAVECARHMAAHAEAPSICCTASSDAFLPQEGQAPYCASKGAIVSMVRALAVDLAPHGVRINAVAPGWVKTPATAELFASSTQWNKFRTQIPLDRPASPEEIAAVVAFLLSGDASYVTGSIVLADGGLTAGCRFSGWEAEPSTAVGPAGEQT